MFIIETNEYFNINKEILLYVFTCTLNILKKKNHSDEFILSMTPLFTWKVMHFLGINIIFYSHLEHIHDFYFIFFGYICTFVTEWDENENNGWVKHLVPCKYNFLLLLDLTLLNLICNDRFFFNQHRNYQLWCIIIKLYYIYLCYDYTLNTNIIWNKWNFFVSKLNVLQ